MKSVVVYGSLWGNAAAVARAIAQGLGPDACALSTTAPAAFVVKGKFGPLKDGGLERVRQWGAELAALSGAADR